jgi:hypothetical protein
MNMKNSDELVDRLLAAVRDAEAPEGMKRRLATRLQNHSQATPVRRDWLRVMPSWAWGACVAGVIVFSMVAVRINHSKNSIEVPTAVKPGAIVATDSVRAEGSAITAARPHDPILRVRAKSTTEEPVVTSDEDSLAVSEMMAPSQPAPEVPLTEQERLLLQVVRRGDPEELALLEPEKRAARNEKEKADVKRFFQEEESSKESGAGGPE